MALLRKIFWLAVFLFSTLCFVVLFEKGTDHYLDNLQKRLGDAVEFVQKQVGKQPAK